MTTADSLVPALDELIATASPHSVLLIDDAESLSTLSGASDRLDTLVRGAGESGLRAVVAVRVNDLPGMYDPWIRYLISVRRVVLLQPTPDDAFIFGAKLPPVPPPATAGRGVFLDRSQATVIQVSIPTAQPLDAPTEEAR